MLRPLSCLTAGGLAVLLLGTSATPQAPPPPVPPAPTCVVPPDEFKAWFGGKVTKNGFVAVPDSVGFPASPNACDFYKWSWQMFLWALSPDHKYGSGARVIDSPTFYDVSAATTVNGQPQRSFVHNRPELPHAFSVRVAQRNNKGQLVKADKNGNLTVVEEGQAGGNGVLVAQSGSLVYYGIHANDVYAEFLTGQKTNKIAATTFPASQADLDKVTAFAATRGKKLHDAKTLVLEFKTSWVELASIPPADQGTFVTMSAVVPTYDKTDPTTWKPTGTKNTPLALVGVHVVGTVNGHPEMVWATFEHKANAPNGTYTYTGADNQPVVHQPKTAGTWTFCQSGAADPFNVEKAKFDPTTGNIVAATTQPIGPSNTRRASPWGDATPNGGAVANNTMILSANASVLGQLLPGDVRRHYVMIGATWTDGKIPGVASPDPPVFGSKTLANSTMETYHQTANCFACHQGDSFARDGLSHIYSDILPLPPKP